MGVSHPGQRVDPTAPRTGAKSPGASDRTRGPWAMARYARESRSTLQDFGHGPESPGTSGPTRGASDPVLSHPGKLSNTSGPGSRARVSRDPWSTLCAHRHRPDSPGTADGTRGHSDPGPSRRDSGSNTRALGTGRESSGTTSRHSGKSDLGLNRPGELVDPAGPRPEGE